MRRLYSAGNITEAYLILHVLERASIPARVLNEHSQGGLGEIPFMHANPEVWVIEDGDFERACSLLDEYHSARCVAGSRRCVECGEENPATFELCWHCGKAITR